MTARQVLWDVAAEQHGFVTARDAADLDISLPTLRRVVERGQLERVAHGVYRFPDFPADRYDSYALAALWTGNPDACLSHDTALELYDVCDINPTKIHVTVPAGKRIRRTGGSVYIIHYEDLAPEDIGWLQEIRATKFIPTLRQCVAAGVPTYLLRQAATTAVARGMLLPKDQPEFAHLLDGTPQ